MTGMKTTNVGSATTLDEVLGNRRDGGVDRTVRQTFQHLMLQVAASEPITSMVEAAAAGLIVETTWAGISDPSNAGTRNSQAGRVTGPDAGTHVDPVTGETVANEGDYRWDVTAAGWQRTGDSIDTQTVAELKGSLQVNDDERLRVVNRSGFLLFEIDGGTGVARAVKLSDPLLDRFIDDGTGRFRAVTESGFIIFDAEETAGIRNGADNGTTQHQALRIWHGAVTDDGFTVNCDVESSGASIAALVVSRDPYGVDVVYASPAMMSAATLKAPEEYWRTASFRVTGLDADQTYHYRVMVDGFVGDDETRTVRTFPTAGVAADVRLSLMSCSLITSNTESVPALPAVAADAPLINLHVGDLMYTDLVIDDVTAFRKAGTRLWRDNLDISTALRTLPIAYIHDDHEINNDAHWDSAYFGGATFEELSWDFRQSYFETVPHYPLLQVAIGPERDPAKTVLAQAFDLAKTRVIMMDTRSQRRYEVGTPTVLGSTSGHEYWDQLTAILDQLTQADEEGVDTVWLASPSGWTGVGFDGWDDHWTAEKAILCDHLTTLEHSAVVILSGDIHNGCFDDGSNTDGSTAGNMTVPQITSSPVHRPASGALGGPFSWNGADGRVINAKQYALIDYHADGSWEASIKGSPFTGTTATVLKTVTSDDAPREVEFSQATFSGAASSTVDLPIERTWFGTPGGSLVDWSSNDGQSGTAKINPNRRDGTIPIVVPAAGSITVTLSNPVRCALGAQTSITVSVT